MSLKGRMTMQFNDPLFLLLFLPLIGFAVFYWLKKWNRRERSIPLSSTSLASGKRSFRALTYPYLPVLRFAAIALLIVALARPGRGFDYTKVTSYGVDIMIVQDLSISMLAVDMKPQNRLFVSKELTKKFVSKRKTDRIGLVFFSGKAYLQAPLTTDYEIVNELIDEADYDLIDDPGTCVGDAITLACAHMVDSPTKSKIILLLTDGDSNHGMVNVETAAKIAKQSGIKIYAIGVGTQQKTKVEISYGPAAGARGYVNGYNKKVLQDISASTGGQFFEAATTELFQQYIAKIDELEKSQYEVKKYHQFDDKWFGWVIASASLVALELLLRTLVYRKVP